MDKVIACDLEGIRNTERKFCRSDRVQVNGENETGVGNNRLHLDGVDERLCESSLLKRGKVETVDIVPDYRYTSVMPPYPPMQLKLTSYLLLLVVTVFDSSHVDVGLIRENQATGGEVPVSGKEYCV